MCPDIRQAIDGRHTPRYISTGMGESQLDLAQIALDGYALGGLLGSGGMGTVYRARQLSLGRPVAIKVLSEKLRAQPRFVAQFEFEARLQAGLEHPHVVPVIDAGECNGVPYIVMRLVDGYSLRELIRAGALSLTRVIDVLTGVASALDYAHARGVLHLDVKPQNVLVETGRHAWIADFGLTRLQGQPSGLTSTSGLLGSFDYLAPEVARGEPPNAACDIYALAVTAFQTLTGALPFSVARREADVLANGSAPRPAVSAYGCVPSALDAALRRGMASDPAERQPSAGALIDDLRQAVGLARLSEPEQPFRLRGADQPALDLATSVPTAVSAEVAAVV
jgi:serine/threonine-protein kinase